MGGYLATAGLGRPDAASGRFGMLGKTYGGFDTVLAITPWFGAPRS